MCWQWTLTNQREAKHPYEEEFIQTAREGASGYEADTLKYSTKARKAK